MKNKNNNGHVFMAFAKGKESTEGVEFPKYIGIAPVYVLAVNPTKEELSKIYGSEIPNDPEYIGVQESGKDKHKVNFARIDFIIKTDKESKDCPEIEMISKFTVFMKNEPRINKLGTKLQIVDKYGRFAWVTKEEASAHAIPQYSNGPANIDPDYRPAYIGEEELTGFMKNYLVIPEVMSYINSEWVPNPKVDPSECEARFNNIADYFKGNFTELKESIAYQPTNKVKVLFGIRTTDDNKQYQAVYTQKVLKNNVTDYSRLDKELQERKQAGAYPTTEFKVQPLQEFNVTATKFNEIPGASDLPFDASSESAWGFGEK